MFDIALLIDMLLGEVLPDNIEPYVESMDLTSEVEAAIEKINILGNF